MHLTVRDPLILDRACVPSYVCLLKFFDTTHHILRETPYQS
jgi:hypothetical protein